MRAQVIEAFYDLEHPENTYYPGDFFEGAAERIANLAAKGKVKAPSKRKQPAKRTARARKPKAE